MKILKIFGLVVGIHVVAFMFVFAIPGCRSTSRHSPPPPASVQAERIPVQPAAPSPISDTSSPVSAPTYSPPADHALNPGASGPAPSVSFPLASSGSAAIRANPTRPGTPAAAAAQAAPVPEMTPATTYVVVSGDNLWKVAKKHGLTSKELATANNLRAEAPLREGQKLLIPGKATPMSASRAQPTSPTGDTLVYKVKAGESLAVIAKRAGTTTATIKSLNHLKSDVVRAGQELTLPAGSAAAAAMASAPSSTDTETAAPTKSSNGEVHHTVRAGENLGIIARHYGVTRNEIAVKNNIADPMKVRPGQDLIIPNAKGPSGNRSGTTAKSPSPAQPAPQESAPPFSPVSPVAAPADTNPVAPIAPDSSTTRTAPPEVPVQDVNPVASPRS